MRSRSVTPVRRIAAIAFAVLCTAVATSGSEASATAPSPFPDPIADIGSFTTSATISRAALIRRWHLPSWWPAPRGRVARIIEHREYHGRRYDRFLFVQTLLDPPYTLAELTTPRVTPAGWRRRPADDNVWAPLHGWQFSAPREATRFTVRITDRPVTGTLLAADYALTETRRDSALPFASPALVRLLALPPGSVVDSRWFTVQGEHSTFNDAIGDVGVTPSVGTSVAIHLAEPMRTPGALRAWFVSTLPAGFELVDHGNAFAKAERPDGLTLAIDGRSESDGTAALSASKQYQPGELLPRSG